MDTVADLDQPAPNFSLPDLEDRFYSLSDFSGKVVILNFWSAECPWSEQADHEMLALSEDWGDKVEVLTIAPNANEPIELLRRSAEDRGLLLVLRDTEQAVTRLYGATTTPQCFVIDADGMLRYRGAFNDMTFRKRNPTRTFVHEVVDALLEDRPLEVVETPAYGCAIVSI